VRRIPRCLLVLAVGIALFSGAAWPIHPRALTFEPLRWDPPTPTRAVLDNGLVVYALEDDEVPIVELTLYLRTGSLYDPEGKSGLARLTGQGVRHGGTVDRSADQIDGALGRMAAELDLYMRGPYAAVSLSTLTRDVDEAWAILADMLRRPAFDPDRIALFKEERLEDIRRRYDRPGTVAMAEFRKRVYGEGSPWAGMATAETISNITREDLVAFHGRHFRPDHCIASVSGDLSRAEMLEKVTSHFGDWAPSSAGPPCVPCVQARIVPSVNYIERDISQSYLEVGHLGYRHHDPNEFAVEMMNYLLGGGGFLSRLTREVRSERGLAYSIRSRFTAEEEPGLFEVACVTDAGTTMEVLDLILRIISGMVEGPPTDEELAKAKEARINEFVFAFDSRAKITRQAAWLEYLGYPADFLDRWVENVRAVTAEDVWQAARSYLYPDGLTVLVVGNERRFDRPLDELGQVHRIEVE